MFRCSESMIMRNNLCRSYLALYIRYMFDQQFIAGKVDYFEMKYNKYDILIVSCLHLRNCVISCCYNKTTPKQMR